MSKSSITIGPKFFANELQNYACPRSAVVRELVQNSVDSRGCTKIEFECGEDWISVKDNGAGMNRDILLNKFLSMGETTKVGDGSVGGFGKARVAVCFAQEGYQIISHDYKLEGVGGDYEIFDAPYSGGCYFKIQTKPTNWERYIKSVLAKCTLRQVVTINGEVYKSDISRGRWARSLSFGEVWVNKSQDRGIIVRVNGVLMFTNYCDAPAQIIIEITPEISREVLLSNRDSLVYEKNRELQAFVNELASESISALKTKTKKFTQFRNKGKAIAARKKPEKAIQKNFSQAGFQQMAALVAQEVNPRPITTISIINPEVCVGDTVVYEQVEEKEIETPKWYDPAILTLESDHPTYVKASKFYDLNNVDESTTRMKLLKVWKTILEFAIEKYVARYNHEFCWGFGWVLSEDCAAQCKTHEDIHYLLLNPIDSDGKMKFSINKREDLSEILIFAVHEISHIRAAAHNESFAQCLTFLAADCVKEISELFRKIKEEK